MLAYDELVLATGAAPFVPPVPGHELPGCFVYRTIEDLDAIRAAARGARTGAVIGGGLLGLEAANALRGLGLDTHVVEMAPRLMAVQIDDAGGATLARHVEALGLTVHTGAVTERILGDGRVTGLALRDAEPLDLDLVVFSAGIRPRDALARAAGLELAERGGVLVDERCRTSDPNVWAIGECAAPAGRMYGLVAPGYAMAEVVVDAILGGRAPSPARTCRPSSSCSASTWRRSATRSRPPRARSSWSSPTRWPASTRSWSSPRTAPGCSAASWSATRRRTACCGRWCRPRPTRGSRCRPTPRS